MGLLFPLLDQNLRCAVTQTFIHHNFYTFNCSYPINNLLVLNYLTCIKTLITLNLTQLNIGSVCPGVNFNPVSAALANCEWCYPKYGCFQVGGPYISLAHPISLPPQVESCIDLKLQLYTQNNKLQPFNFLADDDEIKVQSSPFNAAWPSVFIIGGLQNGDLEPYAKKYIEGFLNCKSYNVFVVNWAKGSGALYEQTLANARLVGAMLAKFIKLLKDKVGYPPSKCHLIGHSAGGIVASEAGKRVEGLGRISGLDSAGIYFQPNADKEICLDASDATFVDVIHTNGGVGTFDKAGHVDFWPNGGVIQTGCDPIRRIQSGVIFDILLCSHVKSIHYYSNTLPCAPAKCNFTSHMCSDFLHYGICKANGCGADGSKCAKMGFNSIDYKLIGNYPLPAPQSFYLTTKPDEPFCED